MTHVKLSMPERGASGGSLELDGEDWSRAVRAVTVESEVGYPNRVTLKLALAGGEVGGESTLYLAAAQVGLLTRFGWTPPVGYEMNERGDVKCFLRAPGESTPEVQD